MSEKSVLTVVLGLVIFGFVYEVWTWVAAIRRSRKARKAYEQLSEQEKAQLESGLFKNDPARGALAKPISPGRALLLVTGGIFLAALMAYMRYKVFKH
jgi:hypothetical protein